MKTVKQTLQTPTPEQHLQELQTQFEDYLKLDQDEDQSKNRFFLNQLEAGKIQINFDHLVLATKKGHLDLLTGIFSKLAYLEKTTFLSKDDKGFTLLHHLAKISDLSPRLQSDQQKITELANLFLANRVHINALTTKGRNTALILAIRYKNTALFTALIAKNARLKTNSPIEHPLAHINHYNAMNKNALDYVMDALKEEMSEEKKQQIKTDYLVPLIRSGVDVIDISKQFKEDEIKLKVTTIIKLIIEHEENLSKVLKDAEEVFYATDLKLSDEEALERLEKFNMKYNLLYSFNVALSSLTSNPTSITHHTTEYYNFCTKLPTMLVENGVTEEDQKNFNQFLERYCNNDLELIKRGITDDIDIDKIKYSFFCKYDPISINLITAVIITFLEAKARSKSLPELVGKFSDPEYDKFNYLSFIYKICREDIELYKKIIETSIENGFNPFSFVENPEQSRMLLDIQMSLGSIIASKYNNGRLVLTLDHKDFSGDFMIQSYREGLRNKAREYLTVLFSKDATGIEGIKEISFYFYSQNDPQHFFKNIFCFLIAMNEGSKTIIRDNPDISTIAHKTNDGSIPISIYRDGQMFYHSSYGFVNYRGEFDEMLKPSSGVMRFNFNLDKQELEGINKRYSFPIKASLQYDIYIGSFKEGLFHGDGFLKFSDGAYYQGSFKKGLFDGNGKIVHPNGTSHEVIFQKGKLLVDLKQGARGVTQRAIDFITENGLRLGVLPSNKLIIQTRGADNEIKSRIVENVTLAKEISKDSSAVVSKRSSAKEDQTPKMPKVLARFITESFDNFLKDFIDDELDKINEFKQLKLELERLEKSFIIISETLSALKTLVENPTLHRNIEQRKSQLQICRQRIDQIRSFFEKTKADLLKTIQIENAGSKLEHDQFQELIGLDSLKAKFQLLKSTQTIVDTDKASSNLITPFVESLQSKLVSSITTETILTTSELNEIKRILEGLYSLTIDQTTYQQIQDGSKDLLSAVLLPISPSLSEQSEFETIGLGLPRDKTKTTAPEITAWELRWNYLSANILRNSNKEAILRHGELIATEEPNTSPRITKANFSLSELSELSRLLNGIDLETIVSNSSALSTQYSSLDNFRSGCAQINYTSKSIRELQQEFHTSLEKLVTDISTSENYDEVEKANLTSHIYNLNAYCIGGQNWQEYVLKNYERLSVQGRLIGLTTGLGHASNANKNELTQMIWTISQLQQIHDTYQESSMKNPAKVNHPLSIQKFQDHLSTIFFVKSSQNPTQTSRGETAIVDFSDQDYLQNLVDYFASISKQDLKPPLDSVRKNLNEFIKENLVAISQDSKSSFTEDFKAYINTFAAESDVDFIQKIRGSEFDLIQPISESAQKNESMTRLRDFYKSQYQAIHAQYEYVEREKSRLGQLRIFAGDEQYKGW